MYPDIRHFQSDGSIAYNFMINPCGVRIQQSWIQMSAILDLIDKEGVRGFCEIGLASGGLGSILIPRTYYDPGFHYMGIELDMSKVNKDFLNSSITQKAINAEFIFNRSVFDCISDIISWMDSVDNKIMIFCDGGNKVKEIEIFSQILRLNDLIMCHDYMPGNEEAIGSVTNFDLQFILSSRRFLEVENYRQWYRIPAFRRIA